jgi:putative ABC transport system substrate-binding protein
MRRRDFTAIIGAAAAFPLTAGAQHAAMPVVGILSGTNREPRLVDAILKGLGERGYVEGRNVAIEFRGAEGNFERLPALAAELVAMRELAVIVAIQSANAPRAAMAASPTTPVVFSIGGDPVRLGLVASLSRPGGNVTGATFLVNTLGAKRLELLRDMVPGATTIGVLVNPKNPAAESETQDVQATARTLGLKLHIENAGSPAEIDAAFASFARQRVDAVTFAADAVFNSRRKQLVALAAQHALPTMYFYRAFADDGGLVSYGGADTEAYRLAGTYAGRILKGERPAELPVQQSTTVELVVNLRTAKTLGLSVPAAVLARADDVIE